VRKANLLSATTSRLVIGLLSGVGPDVAPLKIQQQWSRRRESLLPRSPAGRISESDSRMKIRVTTNAGTNFNPEANREPSVTRQGCGAIEIAKLAGRPSVDRFENSR